MNYSSVQDNKEHLLNLIDWLYKESLSAGGDGDALWYSEYYDVKDILPLIHEYNNKLEYKWKVDFNDGKKLISWWDNQECVLITNNEEIYKTSPIWQQVLLRY